MAHTEVATTGKARIGRRLDKDNSLFSGQSCSAVIAGGIIDHNDLEVVRWPINRAKVAERLEGVREPPKVDQDNADARCVRHRGPLGRGN